MADIPASPADAAQKEVVFVPATEEPIVSIFSDVELTRSSVMMFARREALPKEMKNTAEAYSLDVVYNLATMMMNNRFEEISQKADAPFLGGGMSEGSIGVCPTMDATSFSVVAHEGRIIDGFRAMYTEMERMRRHGFTAGELERAKEELKMYAERQYTNRNDVRNDEYAQRYLDHYAQGTPMMSAEVEWQLDQQMISSISIDIFNQLYSQLTAPNKNLVILARTPEKEGLVIPTKEEILAVIAEVEASEIEAYKDNTVILPLIDESAKLKGSKVAKTAKNESLGYTEWTLKNGIKVVVRPSTLKADEVQISAVTKGGKSLLSNEDMTGMRMLKNASDAKSSEYPNQFNPNDVKQYVRPGVRLSQSDIEQLRKSFTDEQITKMLDHLSDWKRRKGATFTNDFKAINDWVINWLKYHEERERKGNTLNQYRPQQQTRYSIPQTSNGASDGILPDWITEE
jgi:zinc protease